MAAYLGHSYQWRRFETKLARIQAKHGFKIFHAKEFKPGAGEFRGWSDDRKAALIRDFTALVEENLTQGIAVHLEHDRYVNEYKAPPVPKKMRLDTHYGVCFRTCLAQIIHILEQRRNRDRVHVVLEHGHPNAPDCKRIFDDFKKLLESEGRNIFETFSVQEKKACMPLMIADLLAAVYSSHRARRAEGDLSVDRYTMQTPRKGCLAFIELAPDALRNLKINYEAARQLRAAHWNSQRGHFTPNAPPGPAAPAAAPGQ